MSLLPSGSTLRRACMLGEPSQIPRGQAAVVDSALVTELFCLLVLPDV